VLGKQDDQGLFETASQLEADELDEMGLYGQMARYGAEIFKDEDVAHMYDTENERPSTPPSLLARARLLQHDEDISEREVIRCCKYDLRWKVALGLDLETTDKPFARTTFQAFRYRLTLHDDEGIIFEKSLQRAAEIGLLGDKLEVALDSSPIRGRGAVEDTYQQLSSQIGSVLRAVATSEGLEVEPLADDWELSRHLEADSIKGSELVDWDDAEQVDAFLEGLLEEAYRAIELAETHQTAEASVELLERIIDEDVDDNPPDQDTPTVAEGTARERIVSTSDPEMRHGRKSQQGTYDDRKGHIGVDLESRLVLDVEVTAPSYPEGKLTKDAIQRIEAATDRSIEEVLGDSAYGTRRALKHISDLDVDLRTKMPQPNASWRFGGDDFEVSEDGQEVVCPNDQTPNRSYRKEDGWQHFFAESDCQECPLQEQCTNAARRTFFVADDFHERRRRRQWANSKEGRLKLRRRTRVEHALGRLKQWGAGQARYCGRDKTEAQWMWTAAAANLSLIWDAQEAEAPDRREDSGTYRPCMPSSEPSYRRRRRVSGSRASLRSFGPISIHRTLRPTGLRKRDEPGAMVS